MRRRFSRYALAQPGVLFNGPAGDGGGAPPADAPPAADAPPPADAPPAAPKAGESLPDDPAALKAEIVRLRKENGDTRTNAKATAADEARAEMAATIAKALGLGKDAAPTADELAVQVKTAQDTARSAQVELAVYKAAGAASANPTALLDSRSFLAKVADLDPAKAGFADKVSAAIKAAVADHPELKASLVAARSSVDHSGGTGEGTQRKPMSLNDAASKHYGA